MLTVAALKVKAWVSIVRKKRQASEIKSTFGVGYKLP